MTTRKKRQLSTHRINVPMTSELRKTIQRIADKETDGMMAPMLKRLVREALEAREQ